MNSLDKHPTVRRIEAMKMFMVLVGVTVAIFILGIGVGALLYSVVGCAK